VTGILTGDRRQGLALALALAPRRAPFESATPPLSAFRLSVAVEDNAERHADEEEEDGDGVDGVAESGIEAALNAVHRLRALPQVVDTDLGSSSAAAPATIFAGVIGLRLSSILCQVMTRSCFTDSGNASMGSTLAASRACLLTGECSAMASRKAASRPH
jgi:hypothetical protein